MKLLYGPVPDQGITPFHGVFDSDWHLASQRGWLRQKGPESDIISFSMDSAGDTVLGQIFPQLPTGWLPDVFLFCFPERYTLPHDLRVLKTQGVFLVALVGDWYLVLDSLLPQQRVFDHWIADVTCLPYLKAAGVTSASDFPVFSMDLQRFCKYPNVEKDIDVAFIGNLRSSIHTRRARYLRRLASLSDDLSIFIGQELYGEAYVQTFNRAHMVFNLAIHGELNMRCFEALGCGALLLIEADNQEVPIYLEAGKDYVAYNVGNFEALIRHYAEAHDERDQIAQAGHRAIQNYGARKSWQKLKLDLKELWQQNAMCAQKSVLQPSALSDLSADARRHYAHHLFWSVTPPEDYLSAAVDVLRAQSNLSAMDWNDLGVMAYTHCMRLQADASQATDHEWEQVSQAFVQAQSLASDCALINFNQAQMALAQGDYKRAQVALTECLDNLQTKQKSKYWQGLWAYPELGLVFEKFYHPLLHHRQRLMRTYYCTDQAVPDKDWSTLLETQALSLLGYCDLQLQDVEQALLHWQTAFSLAPEWSVSIFADLSEVYLRKNQASKVLDLMASDLGDPLDPRLWLMHCQALHMSGRYAEGAAWQNYYLMQLRALPLAAKSSWSALLEDLPLPLNAASEWLQSTQDEIKQGFHLDTSCSQEELNSLAFASLALDWHCQEEPCPDWTGYAWYRSLEKQMPLQQCRYVLSIETTPAERADAWQRVYDQPSNIEARKLGLDVLPATFAQESLPLEVLPDCHQKLLLCLIQPDQYMECIQFLSHLEQALLQQETINDWSVAIWCSERDLSESEQDWLGESLGDSVLSLFLLPRLQPGEVLSLLKQSQMIWLQPQGTSLYYFWWALHLGLTPWLASPLLASACAYGLKPSDLQPFVGGFTQQAFDALRALPPKLIESMAEIKVTLERSRQQRLALLKKTAYLLRASAHQAQAFGRSV